MYDDVQAKGGAVPTMALDLLQELCSESKKHARKSDKSVPDCIREELELHYLHRLPERERNNIPNCPEVKRAIQQLDAVSAGRFWLWRLSGNTREA
jgi:hypothetical protein